MEAKTDEKVRPKIQRVPGADKLPGVSEFEIGPLRVEARGPKFLAETPMIEATYFLDDDDDLAWRVAEALGEGGRPSYSASGTSWIVWTTEENVGKATLFARRDVVERYDPARKDVPAALSKLADAVRAAGRRGTTQIPVARGSGDDFEAAEMGTFPGNRGEWTVVPADPSGRYEYQSLRDVVADRWRLGED